MFECGIHRESKENLQSIGGGKGPSTCEVHFSGERQREVMMDTVLLAITVGAVTLDPVQEKKNDQGNTSARSTTVLIYRASK